MATTYSSRRKPKLVSLATPEGLFGRSASSSTGSRKRTGKAAQAVDDLPESSSSDDDDGGRNADKLPEEKNGSTFQQFPRKRSRGGHLAAHGNEASGASDSSSMTSSRSTSLHRGGGGGGGESVSRRGDIHSTEFKTRLLQTRPKPLPLDSADTAKATPSVAGKQRPLGHTELSASPRYSSPRALSAPFKPPSRVSLAAATVRKGPAAGRDSSAGAAATGPSLSSSPASFRQGKDGSLSRGGEDDTDQLPPDEEAPRFVEYISLFNRIGTTASRAYGRSSQERQRKPMRHAERTLSDDAGAGNSSKRPKASDNVTGNNSKRPKASDDVIGNNRKQPKAVFKMPQQGSSSPEAELPRKEFKRWKVTGSDAEKEEEERKARLITKAEFKMPPESTTEAVATEKKEKEEKPRAANKKSSRDRLDKREVTANEASSTSISAEKLLKQRAKTRHERLLKKKPAGMGSLDVVVADGGSSNEVNKTMFRMPSSYSDDDKDDRDDEDNGLACPAIKEATVTTTEPILCPICEKPVEEDILYAILRKGQRGAANADDAADIVTALRVMRFTDKIAFCANHKRKTGEKVWVSRGYPDIDWAGLEVRIQGHFGHINGVLEGDTPSAYREQLRAIRSSGGTGSAEDKQGQGQSHRNPHAGRAAVTVPGYYGRRGLQIMSEAIVRQFSVVLRRRAVQDPLIAARGYTRYVQEVLVPELAVRLIMEDMRVDVGKAGQILDESAALGEAIDDEDADW